MPRRALLLASGGSSGVALPSQGRQKWPGSGGTSRAEPAASPALLAALPAPPAGAAPWSRVPRARRLLPPARCALAPLMHPGLVGTAWQTPLPPPEDVFPRDTVFAFRRVEFFSVQRRVLLGKESPRIEVRALSLLNGLTPQPCLFPQSLCGGPGAVSPCLLL